MIGLIYLKEPGSTLRAAAEANGEAGNSDSPLQETSFWEVMKVPNFLLASMIFAGKSTPLQIPSLTCPQRFSLVGSRRGGFSHKILVMLTLSSDLFV